MRLLALAACSLIGLSDGRAGEVVVVEHEPPDMVRVPSGTFLMGFAASVLPLSNKERADHFAKIVKQTVDDCRADLGEELHVYCQAEYLWEDAPHRRVHLNSFYIDRHEVTTAQYRECVAAGECPSAPLFSGDSRYLRSEWPIVNVTWFEARSYCRFRGKRLPSEAEWEKAARGTDGRSWPWGEQPRRDGGNLGRLDNLAMRQVGALNFRQGISPLPLDTAVGDATDGFLHLARPGRLPWGRSIYGVDDMVGNVAEWVEDWYDKDGYGDLPVVNPVRTTPPDFQRERVIRGGSWLAVRTNALPYRRRSLDASSRRFEVGFRCARD